MPPLSDLQQGEVVDLAVDFGDDSEIKIRPALVISQNIVHQNSKGFVFLGITTKPTAQFMLPITLNDMGHGSLKSGSNVIYDKPIWTEQTDIKKRRGKVKSVYLTKILDLVKKDIL